MLLSMPEPLPLSVTRYRRGLDVAWAQVPHGRRALARLSANFYGRPAERLSITGITGTNGKTTTAFILNAMLRAAGRKAALVGTVEYRIGEEVLPAPHTTPEALELNQLFARAVDAGCTEAVMEVSSHALGAAAGLWRAVRRCGVHQPHPRSSRLPRNHGSSISLRRRSSSRAWAPSRRESAVINVEDEYGQRIIKLLKKQQELITYGIDGGDFRAKDVSIETSGTKFTLVTPTGQYPLWSPLLGRVNVLNLIAASAAAYARNVEPTAIVLAAS